ATSKGSPCTIHSSATAGEFVSRARMPHRSVWSFSKRRLLALSSTIRTRLPASSGCSRSAAARSKASTSSATIVKWNVEPFPRSPPPPIPPLIWVINMRLGAHPHPAFPPFWARRRNPHVAKTLKEGGEAFFGDPHPGAAPRKVTSPPKAIEPPSRHGHADFACRCEL